MCGGNQYFTIYHDSKLNVDVKVNFYKQGTFCKETREILDKLEIKEERLAEVVSQKSEASGNFHCVNFSYPNALTFRHYKKLLQ